MARCDWHAERYQPRSESTARLRSTVHRRRTRSIYRRRPGRLSLCGFRAWHDDFRSGSPRRSQRQNSPAQGEYVISTYPGGTYASESGPSFSSPLVAGTVALLLNAKQSGFNQSQVANALANAQALTPDLNHGRLNVYQAVSAWVNGTSSRLNFWF